MEHRVNGHGYLVRKTGLYMRPVKNSSTIKKKNSTDCQRGLRMGIKIKCIESILDRPKRRREHDNHKQRSNDWPDHFFGIR